MSGGQCDAFDAEVAALGATKHQVTQSPFGPDDEIGMLNLITQQSVAGALSRLDPSTMYDLAVDYFIGMPAATYYGDTPFQIWMTHTPRGTVVDDMNGMGDRNALVSYSGESIAMYAHCGTHIDTLPHLGYRGAIWNGFNEVEHLGSRHWTKGGADKYPPIIARAVLIDVAAHRGLDELPESYGIGAQDLEQTLEAQGVSLAKGDVALVRTGRMRQWPDPARFVSNEPGLNREGAEFLARAGVIVVGSDNLAIEQRPAVAEDNHVPVHTYLLAEAGVPLIEMLNLEELAADHVYECVFIAAGLKIRGGTASPVRPIAFPIRGLSL